MNKSRAAITTSCCACLLLLAASCGSNTTKQGTTSNAEGNTSSAPSGQAAANKNVALVRFINGIPDETLTLAFGGNPVFSGESSGTASPYKELPTNQKDFALFPANPSNNVPPLASSDEGISSGNHYTVVAALGPEGKRKLDVITDNLTQPSNGKAEVRLINASARDVNVMAPQEQKNDNGHHTGKGTFNNKAEKLFSSVKAGSSENYKEVDPVNGSLFVERATQGGSSGGSAMGGSSSNKRKRVAPVVEVPVNFAAGKLYTIVLTGGTQTYPLKGMVIEDQLTGPTTSNQ